MWKRLRFWSGFHGVSVKEVLKGLWTEIYAGTVTDVAGQLSYYFMFALFPLLFCLVAVTAYLPLRGEVDEALAYLQAIMPAAGMKIIHDQLQSLLDHPRPKLLSFGLLLAIWSASRAVDAFRRALNIAYDVTESRPFWRVQLLSIGMTLLSALFILASLACIVLGGKLGLLIAGRLGAGQEFVRLLGWLRWPASAVVVMLTVALLYYVLPDVKQEFIFLTPGSFTSTVLWLLGTWAFTLYAEHFGNYNATYGSIGGVMVLMTWLYLSGLVFLLGGKMNALAEHLSAAGKDKGARAPGQAPEPRAARPSGGAPVDAPAVVQGGLR